MANSTDYQTEINPIIVSFYRNILVPRCFRDRGSRFCLVSRMQTNSHMHDLLANKQIHDQIKYTQTRREKRLQHGDCPRQSCSTDEDDDDGQSKLAQLNVICVAATYMYYIFMIWDKHFDFRCWFGVAILWFFCCPNILYL